MGTLGRYAGIVCARKSGHGQVAMIVDLERGRGWEHSAQNDWPTKYAEHSRTKSNRRILPALAHSRTKSNRWQYPANGPGPRSILAGRSPTAILEQLQLPATLPNLPSTQYPVQFHIYRNLLGGPAGEHPPPILLVLCDLFPQGLHQALWLWISLMDKSLKI